MKTLVIAVAAVLALFGFAEAQALGTVNPSTFSFTEPQTNADGTDLADLGTYRLEFSNVAGTGPFTFKTFTQAAPNLNPVAGSIVFIPRTLWGVGMPNNCAPVSPSTQAGCQYWARAVAIDTSGNVSLPSAVVPFFLADSVAPSAVQGLQANP